MDRRGGGPRGGGGGGGGRGGYGGGGGRPSLDAMDYDEIPADLQEDDDNPDAGGAPDITDESGVDSETGALADQDPLEAAIDDLEGRAISALDEFKLHGGTRSSSAPGGPTLHEELAQILRPVLEVSAHVGPALARSHAPYRPNGVDQTVDEMYRRVNSDLIYPVMLETCQSDPIPAKRAAALQFFHNLYKECKLSGSYLDATAAGLHAGPYGEGQKGGSASAAANAQIPPQMRPLINRRKQRTSVRRAELLRYWVEASAHCTSPGNFTDDRSDGAVAARAVLSASAALRPSLRHVADRISSADDAGATRLYKPLARMIAGVLRRLFVQDESKGMGGDGEEDGSGRPSPEVDALRSASVKFLEIVAACFSTRAQSGGGASAAGRKRGGGTGSAEDFALEDLPTGHPIITREALEEIGGYAFNTLRGLTLIGGQVKIDPSLLPDMLSAMDESGYGNNPTGMILDLIKPAALTFLEIESAAMESQQRKDEAAGAEKDEKDGDDKLDINWSTLELDFVLTQKSYSLSINAMSMLATNRPTFFEDSARALALRTMDLPTSRDGGADDTPHRNAMLDSALNKGSAKAIQSQLKASCLTLLRNTLSVTAGGFEILRKALISAGMQIQADKALKVAKQQAELKKAGRAARNRAAIFYEWEAAPDERSSKRQKRTDDALAQMRSARAARGLGGGIQLPSSMTDACELVMLNIDNLPDQRPPGAAASSTDKRKGLTDLASLIDAVLSNGASLATEKGKWYNRDGGGAWTLEVDDDAVMEEGSKEVLRFALDPKAVEAAESIVSKGKVDTDEATRYDGQRTEAASEAFGRLVLRSSAARSKSLADLGNQIAGRLAWTLRNVRPSADLEAATNLAKETIDSLKKECAEGHAEDPKAKEVSAIENISKDYPLVPCCLTLNMTAAAQTGEEPTSALTSLSGVTPSLANRTLNEAYMQSFGAAESSVEPATPDLYESALDLYVSSVVSTCNAANNAPNDAQQKRAATVAAASLPQQLAMLPALGPSSLELTSSLCDIAEITKKAAEASKKSSDKTLAASASIHAAKAAAEKRATQALFALRDAAYQRSSSSSRRSAVDCAVGIASGRLPASPAVEGNALKLVMNVLYVKSADIADCVVAAATEELERTANYAIENFDRIQKANEEAKEEDDAADTNINPLKPSSDVEKEAMDKMRKPVVLFMALCVRRPDIIKTLFEKGSREKADALAKTIAVNMSKLSKAAVTKHGAAKVALQVAEMVDASETSLFLSFLENLVQKSDKAPPKQDLIDACHAIQEKRVGDDGKKDMRYIIPVLSGMTRDDLNAKLPDFVAADDDVFKKAQRRMSERLMKHALVFRDDPGKGEGLLGMTLCEQLVFLHQLDFAAVGLPQKRYLKSIEICLEEDKMFSDRVLMAALDYISGTFLTDRLKLPLAYMRTIILTCSKHESLHSWICHVLLPRLVEGKIYEDRRQWEGWMRCARMLENTGEGVSSLSAIESLPEEQKIIYRSKNPRKD